MCYSLFHAPTGCSFGAGPALVDSAIACIDFQIKHTLLLLSACMGGVKQVTFTI